MEVGGLFFLEADVGLSGFVGESFVEGLVDVYEVEVEGLSAEGAFFIFFDGVDAVGAGLVLVGADDEGDA